MNISFSYGYGIQHKYLCNKPRKKGQLWERKTCKTCALYDRPHCPYCKLRFGLYRIKPQHNACPDYRGKMKGK